MTFIAFSKPTALRLAFISSWAAARAAADMSLKGRPSRPRGM
jgi:hypothetical protein